MGAIAFSPCGSAGAPAALDQIGETAGAQPFEQRGPQPVPASASRALTRISGTRAPAIPSEYQEIVAVEAG